MSKKKDTIIKIISMFPNNELKLAQCFNYLIKIIVEEDYFDKVTRGVIYQRISYMDLYQQGIEMQDTYLLLDLINQYFNKNIFIKVNEQEYLQNNMDKNEDNSFARLDIFIKINFDEFVIFEQYIKQIERDIFTFNKFNKIINNKPITDKQNILIEIDEYDQKIYINNNYDEPVKIRIIKNNISKCYADLIKIAKNSQCEYTDNTYKNFTCSKDNALRKAVGKNILQKHGDDIKLCDDITLEMTNKDKIKRSVAQLNRKN